MGDRVNMISHYNGSELNIRAERSIAHGALTNSKRPSAFVRGVYPTHIRRGHGSVLFDVDGNRYIDTVCGLGTNLFGYGNPQIGEAVARAMQSGGSVFSLGSDLEVEVAETLKGTFPFLERLRFLKTGSEGCAAAVRIARAFTGRDYIISEGYHGWHDEFTSLTPPANGVLEASYILNDMDYLYDAGGEFGVVAAVIIEPVITDISKERREKLQEIREFCDEHGILLIFDETISAYRFPNYCVARHWNILPDLWIGGKAIAGGLPLSVVGGRADVMESDYFVSSTWAGDRLALAAAQVADGLVHGPYNPADLWLYGQEFQEKFNAVSPCVQAAGYPTRGVWKFATDMHKVLWMQEMCKAGILVGPSWFYTKYIHTELDNLLSIHKGVIKNIEEGKYRGEGDPPQSPFAERVRHDEKT
jgi:glutamate-1-semialdehyde aminotransferase